MRWSDTSLVSKKSEKAKAGSFPLFAAFRFLLAAVSLLFLLLACTERNPSYDVLAYCNAGQRRCLDQKVVLICQPDSTWPDSDAGSAWFTTCWDETECIEGVCAPDSTASSRICQKSSECDSGRVCTLLLNPDSLDMVGAYCVTPPYPAGRTGGMACQTPEDCLSGRCTRNVCFEACTEQTDCSNTLHECQPLSVTIDGIRAQNTVLGCVPP